MADAVKSWIHHSKKTAGRLHSVVPLIERLDPNLIALLTCRSVLDGISVPRTINSLAMSVGRYIEDEHKFLYARKHHKGWWKKFFKMSQKFPVDGGRAKFLKAVAKESHLNLPGWKPKERCAVGLVCIELFRQSTGVIDIVTEMGLMSKSYTLVRATDEFLKWLEKSHNASEILNPVFLPTLRTPQDWQSVFFGGYRGNELGGRKSLIKTRNRKYLQTANLRDMPVVYEAVNRIQSTGFVVNQGVLDVLRHCWEHDLCIGDLPNREPRPFPEKPEGMDREARKTWWKEVSRIKFHNECERSKQIAVSKTLWLAQKYQGKTFYFPQECDFRGRIYPTPVFLNVQGADYSRALLSFSESKPVTDTGLSWLAIHGANTWGYDKVSYADRLKVISDNHELIMAIGRDPLGHMDWAKADKPFAFLGFCLEWHKIHSGDRTTNLPVHLDGSNNGLQIFSLLLRDPVGGLATNCLPCDSPRDIYGDVASRLEEKLRESGHKYSSTWLDIGIDRKTTKRVVMCVPYGLTKYSSHEYVRDWYLEKVRSKYPNGHHPFPIEIMFDSVKFLTNLLWESIDEIVHSAKACMDWLREAARIHVENGLPIRWTAPNGLLVQQAYRKTSRISVKTSVGSVVRQHRIVQDDGMLSVSRNVNAISPNFVHSLDASVLMMSVNRAGLNGVNSFSCIHDSIGVNAEDAGIMSASIREVAIEIFSQPVLEQIRDEMLAYLPKDRGIVLPELPLPGTMDITALRDADYFFA